MLPVDGPGIKFSIRLTRHIKPDINIAEYSENLISGPSLQFYLRELIQATLALIGLDTADT